MPEEKKMSDQQQMDVAVEIARLVKEAAGNGGDLFIILNTVAVLSLGYRARLFLDPNL